MMWKAWILPLVVAALALAAADREQCGDFSDVADADPLCKVTAVATKFQPPLFNISKWIWTGENAVPGGANPPGARAFRKTINSPCGKCARHASIIVASDDSHTVFVNGVAIGSGGGFKAGQALYAPLKSTSNLFAIAGNTTGSAAGVIATIRIHYADGSFEDFITDEGWRTTRAAPPKNFHLAATDDTTWPFATLQGTYDNAHWGKPALPPVLGFENSTWIWTSDNVNGRAPKGERAFRKTFNNCGKTAVYATAIIAVDDGYTLYVNGEKIATGGSWTVADAFTIPKLHPAYNTIAVRATNIGGPAGVIANFHVVYSDGTSQDIVTDSTWKASLTVPDGFEKAFADDSEWEDAKLIAKDGKLWNKLRVPLA